MATNYEIFHIRIVKNAKNGIERRIKMIKQATFRDNYNNTLIITKPFKNNVMINVNNVKITIDENVLKEMLKNADKPCKKFTDIIKERDFGTTKLELVEETPSFFKGMK